jgi:hypothetical protein
MFKITVSMFLLISLNAFAQESSDLKKENYFFNIYRNYNESPTPEENWQNALKNTQNQTYQIQNGDTLWDVSNTFFADPKFWPKIWSLNSSEIFNPHEISIENEIVFVPGSIGEPPQVSIQAKTEGEEPAKEEKPAEPEKQLTYELPPAKPSTAVTNIPGSFPPWNVARDKTAQMIFDTASAHRTILPPTMTMDYYIADQMPASFGEIVGTEMGLTTASEFQYIHVKLNSASTQKVALVVRDAGKIQDQFSDKSASLVEVEGTIEILDLINQDENVYRAFVKKVIHPMVVGAQLTVAEMPTLATDGGGEPTPLAARIIGGQFSTERKYFSRDSLVFLNVGSAQGASVGQVLPVYRNALARVPDTKEVMAPRKIGTVKVVNVSDNFSTAIVIDGQDEIQTGDATSPDLKETKIK